MLHFLPLYSFTVEECNFLVLALSNYTSNVSNLFLVPIYIYVSCVSMCVSRCTQQQALN